MCARVDNSPIVARIHASMPAASRTVRPSHCFGRLARPRTIGARPWRLTRVSLLWVLPTSSTNAARSRAPLLFEAYCANLAQNDCLTPMPARAFPKPKNPRRAMNDLLLSDGLIEKGNRPLLPALEDDYDSLGRALQRRGVAIDTVKDKVKRFAVAVPSWGVGVGGTRFAKFPIPGEPTSIFEKLEDCAVIHALGRATPTVSPHFPWDRVADYAALREHANELGLAFDAINSNTFQDQEDQAHSYKFGSLTHPDPAVRDQAVTHNIECIEIGET